MNVLSASVSGEDISDPDSERKIAKVLALKKRRLFVGKRIRTKILKTEKSCFKITKRKTRSDPVSENVKRTVFDFRCSPSVSRTSSNKKDIKRMRFSPKAYSSHQIQFLEKTQTEAYLEFKSKYPEIKISQRLFENYKAFSVLPIRRKYRYTCCCLQNVEMRCVFKQYIQFRKSILKNKSNVERESYHIFKHISDIVKLTLCQQNEDEYVNDIRCLNRECDKCGVNNIQLLPEELSTSEDSVNVGLIGKIVNSKHLSITCL